MVECLLYGSVDRSPVDALLVSRSCDCGSGDIPTFFVVRRWRKARRSFQAKWKMDAEEKHGKISVVVMMACLNHRRIHPPDGEQAGVFRGVKKLCLKL